MAWTDIFKSKQTLKAEAKAVLIQESLRKDIAHAYPFYDDEAVAILEKKFAKPFPEDKHYSDPYKEERLKTRQHNLNILKQTKIADDALKQSDPSKAVQLSLDDFYAFRHITQENNETNLEAKMLAAEKLAQKSARQSSKDKGQTQWFANDTFKSAASGYAENGDIKGCRDALIQLEKQPEYQLSYIQEWIEQTNRNETKTEEANPHVGNLVIAFVTIPDKSSYSSFHKQVDFLGKLNENTQASVIEGLTKPNMITADNAGILIEYAEAKYTHDRRNVLTSKPTTPSQEAALAALVEPNKFNMMDPEAAANFGKASNGTSVAKKFYDSATKQLAKGTSSYLKTLAPDLKTLDRFMDARNGYYNKYEQDRLPLTYNDLVEADQENVNETRNTLMNLVYKERVEPKFDQRDQNEEVKKNLEYVGDLAVKILTSRDTNTRPTELFVRELILKENEEHLQKSDPAAQNVDAIFSENKMESDSLPPYQGVGYSVLTRVKETYTGKFIAQKIEDDLNVQAAAIRNKSSNPRPQG